jgi:hypothetical protein
MPVDSTIFFKLVFEKFNVRARRLEEMESEKQIDLAIARLSRMGLPITSVEQGIVTIDL